MALRLWTILLCLATVSSPSSSVDVGKYSAATLSSSADWTSAAGYQEQTGVRSRWEVQKPFCSKHINFMAFFSQHYVRGSLRNKVGFFFSLLCIFVVVWLFFWTDWCFNAGLPATSVMPSSTTSTPKVLNTTWVLLFVSNKCSFWQDCSVAHLASSSDIEDHFDAAQQDKKVHVNLQRMPTNSNNRVLKRKHVWCIQASWL